MYNRYLILSICTIISTQSTISAFSFKKLYTSIMPSKLEQAVIYEEYPSKGVNLLRVNNLNGNVTVKTDAEHTNIFLKAIKKSPEIEMLNAIAFSHKTVGQEMLIESKYDQNTIDGSIDFELIVPEKMALNISVQEGNVLLKQPYAPCMVTTHKGSIDIIEGWNTIDAKTTKGAIAFHKPHKRIKAQTTKGNISIYDAQESVHAHSDYGTIEMFAKEIASTSTIKLTTVTGPILLHLPPDVNADVQASTKQGSITCDHFITLKPQTTQLNRHAWKRIQKEIDGTLGTGEAQITLSSVRSDIKLLGIKA